MSLNWCSLFLIACYCHVLAIDVISSTPVQARLTEHLVGRLWWNLSGVRYVTAVDTTTRYRSCYYTILLLNYDLAAQFQEMHCCQQKMETITLHGFAARFLVSVGFEHRGSWDIKLRLQWQTFHIRRPLTYFRQEDGRHTWNRFLRPLSLDGLRNKHCWMFNNNS